MFGFSWIGGPNAEGAEAQAAEAPIPPSSPSRNLSSGAKAKRKRQDSGASSSGREAKRQPHSGLNGSTSDDPSISSEPTEPPPAHINGTFTESVSEEEDKTTVGSSPTLDETQLASFKEAIETQFGLEILLKHRELRLIEQELAKCQVALEQLRRCSLIPYPGNTLSPFEEQLQISSGTGPALQPAPGMTMPESPAPWGVTNGPYTRHYAKWLIPDPKFDGVALEDHLGHDALLAARSTPDKRPTRSSLAGKGTPSRPQRGSTGPSLQALGTRYPSSRDKSGPLIIKRSSDGQLVRLVCIDCDRGDFSSAQGFINHCRIAHHRGFESHDAAALACGIPLETDEGFLGSGGPEANSPGSATNSSNAFNYALVHPLIRTALPATPSSSDVLRTPLPDKPTVQKASVSSMVGPHEARPKLPVVRTASSYVPCAQTPHLSVLLASRGFAGNLNKMVEEVTKKVQFSDSDSESEESARSNEKKVIDVGDEPDKPFAQSRVPARGGLTIDPNARPGSSKGPENFLCKPSTLSHRPGFAATIDTSVALSQTRRLVDGDVTMLDVSASMNLSPNIESITAPSLVSDDDDYEAPSESDSPSSAEDGGEENDVVDVDIEGDEEAGCGSETTTDAELAKTPQKAMPRRAALRRAVNSQIISPEASRVASRMRPRRDDKHVSFASPAKDASPKSIRPKRSGGGRMK
ncbi:MAG: hypothetical protein M1829_003758 [Trizodia sp. TS-e1964]|nr:MAG: hypothetical protein M1829_003758 [Trizodia sp. TS-e1964]